MVFVNARLINVITIIVTSRYSPFMQRADSFQHSNWPGQALGIRPIRCTPEVNRCPSGRLGNGPHWRVREFHV